MLQCPTCDKHLFDSEQNGVCDFCGTKIILRYPPSAGHDTSTVSWEKAESMNIFFALISSVFHCLFLPGRFFGTISSRSTPFCVLLFGLSAGSIGALAAYFWDGIFSIISEHQAFDGFETALLDTTGSISWYASPLLIFLEILLLSIYMHFFLIITRARHNPFRATFAVASYAQSASVLAIIPILGPAILPFWMLVVLTAGISVSHHISKTRAFMTLTLPILIPFLAISILLFAAICGSFLISSYFKDFLPFFR